VTTPGFIKAKLKDRKGLNLSHLKLIIYDEADELFIQPQTRECFIAFKTEIEKAKVTPQYVLFSATFPPEVIDHINAFVPGYVAFTISTTSLKLSNVKQYRLMLPGNKMQFLEQLYSKLSIPMTMIFVNQKKVAADIKTFFEKKGITSLILTGDLQNEVRDEIIEKFRNTEFNVLISTNVLARGIDVPEVDLVVNYDVPYLSQVGFKVPDYANYIHRVGRTGRFGTDGLALTLCADETDEDLVK
jgi:ATP-dependent RNA helicase DDX19/DBP5